MTQVRKLRSGNAYLRSLVLMLFYQQWKNAHVPPRRRTSGFGKPWTSRIPSRSPESSTPSWRDVYWPPGRLSPWQWSRASSLLQRSARAAFFITSNLKLKLRFQGFLLEKPASEWCYGATNTVLVRISGHVLFLSLPLRGALHIPHQRFNVGRRDGRSHVHVLSQSEHRLLQVLLQSDVCRILKISHFLQTSHLVGNLG